MNEEFNNTQKMYFLWKDLNILIEKNNGRKIPFNDAIIKLIFERVTGFISAHNFIRNYPDIYREFINSKKDLRMFDYVDLKNKKFINMRTTTQKNPFLVFSIPDTFDELHLVLVDEFYDTILFYKTDYEKLSDLKIIEKFNIGSRNLQRIRLNFKKETIESIFTLYYTIQLNRNVNNEKLEGKFL